MSGIDVLNGICVGIFGMVLSAAFCNIIWNKKRRFIIVSSIAVILMLQGIFYVVMDSDVIRFMYPFITHIPLAFVLVCLSKKRFWPFVSVLTAYLCCQLRRWLALVVVAAGAGGDMMQDVAEIVITFPMLLLLLRFIAPSVSLISRYPFSLQCQFGAIPLVGYGFDYMTRIYTDLLARGSMAVVEFMPFVCSVAYLIFVIRASEAERVRNQLEQVQASLNIQIDQAVREIDALRESQRITSTYRHDLRHHMRYLSSCLENGRVKQAQNYIRAIYSEIEANNVIVFCENEDVNLIFSSFTGKASRYGIPIKIKAEISKEPSIAEVDLCVLLSNALENAIHACKKQKENGLEGKIEVVAYERNGKLFLQIVNSCSSDVVFKNGIPVTSTPGHGIGVQSICAIVERYGGIYSFVVEDGQFILRVSL